MIVCKVQTHCIVHSHSENEYLRLNTLVFDDSSETDIAHLKCHFCKKKSSEQNIHEAKIWITCQQIQKCIIIVQACSPNNKTNKIRAVGEMFMLFLSFYAKCDILDAPLLAQFCSSLFSFRYSYVLVHYMRIIKHKSISALFFVLLLLLHVCASVLF